MKNNIYFHNIEEIGELYLEHIFYEFEMEPVLFVCSDSTEQPYLCLCTEMRQHQKWLISKSSTEILKLLINKQLDIAEAISIPEKLYIVEQTLENEEQSYSLKTELVDPLDLPEPGTYLLCDEEKAVNFLWVKELLISLHKTSNVLNSKSFNNTLDSYNVRINSCINVAIKQNTFYEDSANRIFASQIDMFCNGCNKELMTVHNEYDMELNTTEQSCKLNDDIHDNFACAA